jgi:hypothetical protein
VHNEKSIPAGFRNAFLLLAFVSWADSAKARGVLCLEGGARRVVLVCYGGFEGWSPRLIEWFSSLNWL